METIKTWNTQLKTFVETPVELKNYFNEFEQLCRKYNFSIGHEDVHGAFIINKFTTENIEWLKSANLDVDSEQQH